MPSIFRFQKSAKHLYHYLHLRLPCARTQTHTQIHTNLHITKDSNKHMVEIMIMLLIKFDELY